MSISIQLEDLDFIEEELHFDDKVAVLFLLYGHRNPKYVLQLLTVAIRAPDARTQFLSEWANLVAKGEVSASRWQSELLEALAIVQANLCLLKCGFDDEELRAQFLPHVPELATHVHPVLKGLWMLCEKMDKATCGRLENYLMQNYALTVTDSEFLEMVMLDMIGQGVIKLGSKEDGQVSDLSNLIAAFKALELEGLKDFCKNIESNFNRDLQSGENQSDNAKSTLVAEVKRQSVDNSDHLEKYVISWKNAGLILIVNQFQFFRDSNPELADLIPSEPLKNRRGTEVDKMAILNLFTNLGYEPIVVENIPHLEIMNQVEQAVDRVEPHHCSLVICLLSHGQEGKVYGSNSIPVSVKAIERKMAARKLTGKPKLLFVQACQGSGLQTAVDVAPRLEHDGPSSETTASVFVDFLVAWSTVPGFASIRHIEKGSWFIQELCSKIRQLYERDHLMDILTAVINDVSAKRGYENECMVPIIYTTLRKKLYFEALKVK
ncbi:AAEL014148-PA [Aedes aegypti]|uniref:AAEL014148-PA n=1 Tax=Aedes aegypti TaxID=7159 RepID=Q16H55_AEDAE|nr:AAEL014148-PA [Aedes aegypti]